MNERGRGLTDSYCVEVEYEGKTRRSRPMPFEDALSLWGISGDLTCRITRWNSRIPLWPANDSEAADLRMKWQAENSDE